jgi:integrase/recombinase XerD
MHGSKPGDLKDELIELSNIEKRGRDIAAKIKPFSFETFGKKFLDKQDANTLKFAFDSYIAELKDRPGTATNYNSAFISLNKFKPDSLLADITPDFLKDYEQWMDDQGRSKTSTGMYLRALRAIINASELPASLYPFGKKKYSPPKGAGNPRALDENIISKIYNYKGEFQKAKDFWLFSYFGNGINMKDICRLKYSDIDMQDDIVSFYRAKTLRTKKEKKLTQFHYTSDLKRIIKKYGTHGVYHDSDDYIFDVLEKADTPKKEMQLKDQFIHVINSNLKEIAKELKIKPFTTYSSRHSWTTVQVDAGVSIADISRMLHDGNISTTVAYVGKLNTKKLKAVSKNLTPWKKAKVVSL